MKSCLILFFSILTFASICFPQEESYNSDLKIQRKCIKITKEAILKKEPDFNFSKCKLFYQEYEGNCIVTYAKWDKIKKKINYFLKNYKKIISSSF